MKVCKFGGTSMGSAESIKKVMDIVKSDKSRGFVVVSAPGKIGKSFKVTDALIDFYNEKDAAARVSKLESIKNRFADIATGLCVKLDLNAVFEKIACDVASGAGYDYTISRGEYVCAMVLAQSLNYAFVDAAQLIRFKEDGAFDADYTDTLCRIYFKNKRGFVIPGFYGATGKGEIKTFSRGGSDISGAIIARAIDADIYENWTDVDGFMLCDPRITGESRVIAMLTYKELRELSYMGANVLHPESIFPVRKSQIPIHIKNTFNPDSAGTLIVPTKKYFKGEYKRDEFTVTGIAGKKDFVAVHIDKSMMNSEIGYVLKVLSVFERLNVAVEHIPSGIDTLNVVFERLPDEKLNALLAEINLKAAPDQIELLQNFALIAVVGHGMIKNVGTASRVFASLNSAGINVRMIDQGSSEMNIIIGVSNSDYERAIIALYNEFK